MNIRTTAALILLCASHAVMAAPSSGDWAVSLSSSPEFSPQGLFHSGSTGQIADLGTLNGSLTGTTAVTALNRVHFHDALAAGAGVGLEVGYAVDEDFVPYAQLHYADLRGRSTAFGGVTTSSLLLPANIQANFSDWRSVELNLGMKYYLADGMRMRPYFAGYIGANRSGDLTADISAANLQVDLGGNVLLPAATRFDAGLASGVSYEIASHADLLFQVGADYVGAERRHSAAFAPLGVASVTVGDRRLDLSAVAGVGYNF